MRIRFLFFAIIGPTIAFASMPTAVLAEGPSNQEIATAESFDPAVPTTTPQFGHSPVVPQVPGATDNKVTVPTVGPDPGDPKPGVEGLPKGTAPPKPGIEKPGFELCLEETVAECEDLNEDSYPVGVVVELPCELDATCVTSKPTDEETEGGGGDDETPTPSTVITVPEPPTPTTTSPTTTAKAPSNSQPDSASAATAQNIDSPRPGVPNFTG